MERLLRLRGHSSYKHLLKMYEEDEDLLEDVIIENKQAIEMVEMYSNILMNMMNAFTSIISNNLNMVMKMLAALTITLAVPTIILACGGPTCHCRFKTMKMVSSRLWASPWPVPSWPSLACGKRSF